MKKRLRGPVAVMALAVASMVGGFLAITAPAASASGPNNWYVATTGTNTANACQTQASPCQTISYALLQQAATLTGGTIHVAAGTYTEQLSILPVNDSVKIVGAGSTTVVQPPASSLLSDTDTDGTNPQYYVIDVAPTTTGVKLQDLSVNGTNAIGSFDTDGFGCAQDYVGIYYHSASGTIKDVSVNGIDMPPDLFGCQGGQGIYVNSTPTGTANVTMSGDTLNANAPAATKTRGDLPAGSYTNDQLAVVAVPAGWHSGVISVNGINISATKNSHTVLNVTGTMPIDAPKHSIVEFNVNTPAYDKNGITCDDANTSCTISNATVQGAGPINSIAQNGIQAFAAASISISNSTVSGDSYAGGGAGNSASGILILNSGTVSVQGNTATNSDVNIYAGNVPAFGLSAASIGNWSIGGNTVSGATSVGESAGVGGFGEGIQLDSTSNPVVVEGNTVSTSAQSDLLLTGVSNAGIGAVGLGDTGNTLSGSQAGLVLGGPGTQCEAVNGPSCAYPDAGYGSSSDAFFGNTMTGDMAGAVIEGAYAPNELGLSSAPGAAIGNDFSGNSWSTSNEINMVDFSGFNNPGPPFPASPPSAPVDNSYGTTGPNGQPSNTPDSCEPSPGGSSNLLALSGGEPLFYSC